MNMIKSPTLNQDKIMSKWIARESNLSNPKRRVFIEVGHTDFGNLVQRPLTGSLYGVVSFTTSLCGRYLLATHAHVVHIYELNHVCPPGRSAWSIPLRPRQGMPLGFLRPVATVTCPRRIIACSMDTSAGRFAAAFLMDGRMGMVCDIVREGRRSRKTSCTASPRGSTAAPETTSGANSPLRASKASRLCMCHESSPHCAPRAESGHRSIYRHLCHPDDPPRSVAICPQRNCVAFGCSSGIELHWVDALAGQDLSRWFPLSCPSDFLYFLPVRRGLDTSKRLRLISSASALLGSFDSAGDLIDEFGTSILGSGSAAVVTLTNMASAQVASDESRQLLPPPIDARTSGFLAASTRAADYFRRVSAGSADHYRAVPLSDGHHILFTDPRTGNLCLGTDAPVGSLTRLLRKVWFRPPAGAASQAPTVYVAGADTRHGVRVAAAFSIDESCELAQDTQDYQMIVFYSVPPDLFHDMSPRASSSPANQAAEGIRRRRWVSTRQQDEGYRAIDIFCEPYEKSAVYPIEIKGQPVAMCSQVVELALESSPEMIIWAFSAEGWAKTWAVDTGSRDEYTRTAVQRDGGVRRVDHDGDVDMVDTEDQDNSWWEASLGRQHPYDGAAGNTPIETDSQPDGYFSRGESRGGERMSGTVSVDLVEEVHGIVRLDVELR
ncbi:hypothetical protein HIM_08321 [Hirsutella minnesotensis 3608]|uniref:F-box domain-containing protein n=1 Tax=Hirsutella minnesotensis 3608 TaxID=1043627 RepID=A0A0F7ZMM9_9HYPO|nr:hypothetical protein HIM_08321 [Hirsutella minnesotensis 3608]